MKRLSTALVLFILLGFVMVTVTGCVTYAKLFGIIPNTDSYLADFKPLVGKDYYLRADILSCSSQDELAKLSKYRLTKLGIKLTGSSLHPSGAVIDECDLTYFLNDSTRLTEERQFITESQASNSDMFFGNAPKKSELYPSSPSFVRQYVSVDQSGDVLAQHINDLQAAAATRAREASAAQAQHRSDAVKILLVGEANGVKVTLDVGRLPDQTLSTSNGNTSFEGQSVLISMMISSSMDVHLNPYSDSLAFAFNGRMSNASLISYKAVHQYPQVVIAGTSADFEIEITPQPFVGFTMSGPVLRAALAGAKGSDLESLEVQVSGTYAAIYHVGSLNLDIPMKVEVTIPD